MVGTASGKGAAAELDFRGNFIGATATELRRIAEARKSGSTETNWGRKSAFSPLRASRLSGDDFH
jgi:hypothetical protein